MTEKTKVIVIRETLRESIISDTYSLMIAFGMMLPGYLLDINALQWLGAVMFIITLLAMGFNSKTKLTIAEAREYLDKLEEEAK
jgi:hypothetical protein